MYHMKNIINHNERIAIPKCMYTLRNPNESMTQDENDLEICEQVPNKEMAELEHRQNQLLNKLDNLYDRIKTISAHCNVHSDENVSSKVYCEPIPAPKEVVIVTSPENLPWYLNIILKKSTGVNITWHIHSSVSNEKIPKIKAFVRNLQNNVTTSNVNLRLIFKNISADAELKLSSLSVPIIGSVNILRYLAFTYPNIVPYDSLDYYVDTLLDQCHILERASEKNKESIVKALFSQQAGWIYNKDISIVDIAAYTIIKQWNSCPKYVPKSWFDKCEKLCIM